MGSRGASFANSLTARLIGPAFQAALVAVAAVIARYVTDHITLIPRFLLHLPVVTYSNADFAKVVIVLAVATGLVFAVSAIRGANVFCDARRVSVELYALIFGFTLGTVYLFLFGDVVFSPELIVGTLLFAVLLFTMAYIIGEALFQEKRLEPVGSFVRLASSTLRMALTPWALAVLLIAITPVVAAKAYVSNRDFANLVTRLRMMSEDVGEQTPYQLTSAFPGQTFLQPIDVQFPADGARFTYVLERAGKLWRIPTTGAGRELLLDFSGRVGPTEAENGALGFDLHPEFGRATSARRGHVFIYYTDATIAGGQKNRLVRFDVSLPTVEARSASETVLIEFSRTPNGFHNGGAVKFGKDGFLYIALGEAQDASSRQRIDSNPAGGIWRIDVDERGGDISHPIRTQPRLGQTQNYFVPSDNPFVGEPGVLEEFWALGLRNPFRFSFDPQTDLIWAGDVGSDVWEEINLIVKGGNYQFPYIEGRSPMARQRKPAQIVGEEQVPVYFYRHTAFDRVVIGGEVYQGALLPELRGQYIFADNYSGRLMAFSAGQRHVEDVQTIARSSQVAQFGIAKLTNGPDGNFYVVALGSQSQPTGEVLKLVNYGTAPRERVPELTAAVSLEQLGQELFSANCSRCHGVRGEGEAADANQLPVKPRSFRDPAFARERTVLQTADIIRRGGVPFGMSAAMPPWMGVLSDREIDAVAAYVHSLSRTPG